MVKRNVTILGINDGHDAGAALIRNGRVLAAIQEERLVNIKHYSGVPEKAIKMVFKVAGVHPSEVDAIAIGSLLRVVAPLKEEESFKVKLFKKLSLYIANHIFVNILRRYLHNLPRQFF